MDRQTIRDFWDYKKRFTILAIRVSGEEKNNKVGKVLKDFMAKYFPNMARNINFHIQEVE